MIPLAEILKSILTQASGDGISYPQGNDTRMAVPPMEGENSGRIMQPDQMMKWKDRNGWKDDVIYTDDGQAVDMATNPFKKLLSTNNGQGSISGLLQRLLNPTPEAQNPGMDKSGVTPRIGGTGDPNHVPGTGKDAVLDPTPMPKQKQRNLKPRADLLPETPPVDYSQPTALDPQSIEELRLSLLTQSGMLDPGNPNGLPALMSGPYSAIDMKAQADEANAISDAVRGPVEEDRIRKMKGPSR